MAPGVYGRSSERSSSVGGFRWALTTCVAAAVGAVAIAVAISGSMDTSGSPKAFIDAWQKLRQGEAPIVHAAASRVDGLNWVTPKADKLRVASGVTSMKLIIHESQRHRRGAREYIQNKPYARVLARLGAVTPIPGERIPPFNPLKLYANSTPVGEANPSDKEDEAANVSVRVVELLGGILPGEDGQEIDSAEAGELVARSRLSEAEQANALRPGFAPEGIDRGAPGARPAPRKEASLPEAMPPRTTVLVKNTRDNDEDVDDIEGKVVEVVKLKAEDTLTSVLAKLRIPLWQARQVTDAARTTPAARTIGAGDEVHATIAPSPVDPASMAPLRVSVFGPGHVHKATVIRSEAGDLVRVDSPYEPIKAATNDSDDKPPASSSLYTAIFRAAHALRLEDEIIFDILRIHAYDTDFRKRARSDDSFELFFDTVDRSSGGSQVQLGELLYTAMTTSGETRRFYRFRSSDGHVDFYDEYGTNSRKFLMRRPVRGDNVRLTSGFGMRRHPILNINRMHTGVDWSAPTGTPILAAGNGVIEEARRKGYNGNYIRIRHANGYKTAYSHLSRFAKGVTEGVRVRQGQMIGYVGSTGLSSGPHLHYEVLIGSNFVNPMRIDVPRERQLAGRDLKDFHQWRSRIDDLKRRVPVKTEVVEAAALR